MRSLRTITLAALAGVLALGVAACGSSSSSKSANAGISAPQGVQTPATESLTGGTKGGTLNVLNHEDFEHIDPGQSYFAIDYEAVYATNRPLYSYKPNTFASPSPDMAESAPQISSDAKTVTIHIRHGVHFGPPVNREVTSADVAYALDRGANPNVANPYFEAYFKSLEGFSKANGGPIQGITTPDKYTIVLKLTEPKAGIVASALVLPVSAPVPEEYAKKFDAKKPSEYGNYQVATGPYMWKADSSGKIAYPGTHVSPFAATHFKLGVVRVRLAQQPDLVDENVARPQLGQLAIPCQIVGSLAFDLNSRETGGHLFDFADKPGESGLDVLS